MATSIATTTGAFSGTLLNPNGRHIDVDSSGKRWVAVNDNGTIKFYYSSSPASSWTLATGTVSCYAAAYPFSFFIDVDDGFHLVYVGTTGTTYFEYRYGTESAGTITWSSAVVLSNSYAPNTMDMVAHKVGSDYWAHCFMTNTSSGVYFRRVKITSGTPAEQGTFTNLTSFGNRAVSIDFRHTGDGKTVASSSPDVFVAICYSGPAIYYYKFTYSAGPTWTPGTVRTMSAIPSNTVGNVTLGWDGTAVMIAYLRSDLTGVNLTERDLADTTTTTRGTTADPGSTLLPSLVWDSDRNIYLAGVESGTADPMWTKWTRKTSAWAGSWTTLETATSSNANVSAIRHHQSSAVEVIYSRDLATDDVAWVEATSLNVAPTAPTWTSPADGSTQDVAETLLLDWTFNDPDFGDTQSAYTLRRTISSTVTYWNGSTWQSSEDASTKIAASTTSQTLATSWGSDSDADHYYAVKTWDAADAGPSDWSSSLRVVPSAQDNPSLTAPTGTVGPSETATWTVSTQTKYRAVVSDTSSTTDMDAGTLEDDTGIVVSSSTSATVTFPTNSVTRYVRIQTWNDEGLASDIDQNSVTVSYTPPSTPTLSVTADSPSTGAIGVTITNPGLGATEDYNDLYRREGTDSTTSIRVATNVAVDGSFTDWAVASGVTYQYLARCYATNGTTADSAWTA